MGSQQDADIQLEAIRHDLAMRYENQDDDRVRIDMHDQKKSTNDSPKDHAYKQCAGKFKTQTESKHAYTKALIYVSNSDGADCLLSYQTAKSLKLVEISNRKDIIN